MVYWMREAELKHGRICMLAWTGWVAVDLGIKFPGEKYAALSSFTAHEGTATYELFFLLLCPWCPHGCQCLPRHPFSSSRHLALRQRRKLITSASCGILVVCSGR